ncbi:pilin [Patescibacteria group bacterium]|nr:pilin [Patescibacteria group bacterium]
MKKVFTFIVLPFLALIIFSLMTAFPKQVSAQGSCVCLDMGTVCSVEDASYNCDSGFHARCNTDCSGCSCVSSVVDWSDLESVATPGFPAGSTNLGHIINRAIPYIFAIAGFLLLIFLIIGGFGYMTSGGDPKTMAAAQQKITNALIGFVIIFLAYWIVVLIGRLLGIPASRFPF